MSSSQFALILELLICFIFQYNSDKLVNSDLFLWQTEPVEIILNNIKKTDLQQEIFSLDGSFEPNEIFLRMNKSWYLLLITCV